MADSRWQIADFPLTLPLSPEGRGMR